MFISEEHHLTSHSPYKIFNQCKCANMSEDVREQQAAEKMPSFNFMFK